MDEINASSTVVIAAATVTLTWVAIIQIKHRSGDRREQRGRLDAVAKHHGLLVQRALREAVVALDALRLHDRTLASWRQQASLAFNLFVEARRELEQVMATLIERHAGTPAAIEEMLSATLSAFDATRELAGPTAPAMAEGEIVTLYAKARKQALVCLKRLQSELGLPPLAPLFQPTEASGALGASSAETDPQP